MPVPPELSWFAVFVISTVVTIIINIVSNIFTDPVRNWWAETSKTRASRRADELEEELRQLEFLNSSPKSLDIFLHSTILVVIERHVLLIISLVLSATALMITLHSNENIFTAPAISISINGILISVSYIINLYLMLTAFRASFASRKMLGRINEFETYREIVRHHIDRYREKSRQ